MNLKSNKKSKFWCIPYVMLTLLAFFLGSCDDGKEVSPITGSGGTPFNPAFPIRIDSIYPKAGSAGQRVLIYGENFGNNPSQLEVYIGGQKSSVVNVKSTYMYCLMPSKAYEGDIQVTIKDGEKTYTSEKSDVRFEYQRLKVVSTLLGEVNPQISDKKKNFEIKDGPFDNCGGVANPCFMKWDPEYPELLYFAEDTSVDPEGVTGSVYAVLISDGNNYILFFLGVSMEGMSVGVLLIFLKIRTECIIWLWLHHKLMQLIPRSICLIVFQIQLNHVVLNGQIEEQL